MAQRTYLSQIQDQRLQQVLAPQLRQSLELLQVPILELRALVEQELQQNPTLEEKAEKNTEQIEVEQGTDKETPEKEEQLDFEKEDFEVLARLDQEWREYFSQLRSPAQNYQQIAAEEKRRQFLFDSLTESPSLQEHLMEQLAFSDLDQHDRRIGEMLVGCINEDGYLATSLEELAESGDFELSRLQETLETIKNFDPIGIGSRNLTECLLTQVHRAGRGESLEANIITEHLDALGQRKYSDIAKTLKAEIEEVHEAAKFISTLEPKPGRSFSSEVTTYVLPEIEIQKIEGKYTVFMDKERLPRLRTSRRYLQMLDDPQTPADVKEYIRDKLRAGTLLIKSIGQRQETIRKICEEIIVVQESFFDSGLSGLKPLTMAEVAEKVGIHETTVSRAAANKYVKTPQGVFELKYFFTPGYKNKDGDSVSNLLIKDKIKDLIDAENGVKPLSDQGIAEALKEEGYSVARRTVAKYREELKILPSYLRKA